MADFRANPEAIAEKRAHFGAIRAVSITACFLMLLLGLLFASGYWNESAKRTDPAPRYDASLVGGPLPGVVVEPIRTAVGTMKLPVDPPAASVSRAIGPPTKAMIH